MEMAPGPWKPQGCLPWTGEGCREVEGPEENQPNVVLQWAEASVRSTDLREVPQLGTRGCFELFSAAICGVICCSGAL